MAFTSGQILTAAQLNTFDPGTKITNAGGTAGAPSYTFNGDTDTGMFRTGANAVGIATGGTLRATFDASGITADLVGNQSGGSISATTGSFTGDVDIANSTPVLTLKDTNNTGTSNFQLKITDSADTNVARIYTGGGDNLRFEVAGSDVLFLDQNGRVGIGTTVPHQLLDIEHATDAIMTINDSGGTVGSNTNSRVIFQAGGSSAGQVGFLNTGSGIMGVQNEDGPLYLTTSTADDILIRPNGSTAVTIASDGDVGIGETTPGQRLHVNSGNTNTTAVFESTDGTAIIGIKDNATSGNFHVGVAATGDDLKLRANNGNRVTVSGSEMIPSVDLRPSADGTIDLGTSTYRWQAVHSDRYYLADSDSYMQFDADSGGGLDGPGIRFVINGSEMFKFQRENDTSTHAMLTFGETNDGILYEKDTEQFNWYVNSTRQARLGSSGDFIVKSGATFKGDDDDGTNFPTGSGTDARIITGFGLAALVKYSSIAADKENISADLGTHLTVDMIDSIVPKMWNRISAPGYPEIGPIADEMDAISPFLATHGTTADGDEFLSGVETTAWLSLMTLAIQDLRTRVATLEAA